MDYTALGAYNSLVAVGSCLPELMGRPVDIVFGLFVVGRKSLRSSHLSNGVPWQIEIVIRTRA